MTIGITRFDHVNLRVPAALEEVAKQFYKDVLGLEEVEKPADSRSRGGAWYRCGDVGIHLSRSENPVDNREKRHVCFVVADLAQAEQRFRSAGVEVIADEQPTAGWNRFYVRDPGDNLLEIAQKVA